MAGDGKGSFKPIKRQDKSLIRFYYRLFIFIFVSDFHWLGTQRLIREDLHDLCLCKSIPVSMEIWERPQPCSGMKRSRGEGWRWSLWLYSGSRLTNNCRSTNLMEIKPVTMLHRFRHQKIAADLSFWCLVYMHVRQEVARVSGIFDL